ncbi:MAG: pilus assembly protein TadG-related protein, partial [Alphaproteobacteria bacterium]
MTEWYMKLPIVARGVALWSDRRGAVAVYVAIVGVLIMGSLVLGVDIGRMAVLRAQLQNAADAAALAAASVLDGSPGSRVRATGIATTTASDSSRMTVFGGDLTVSTVEFFSVYVPGGTQTPATGDDDANFVRVNMTPENIEILFQPVLQVITEGSGGDELAVAASAAAGNSPIVCNVTPFMVCDFTAGLDLFEQLAAGNFVGQQLLLKPQGGPGFVPGNYGLLCVDGDCGASSINEALVAVESGVCT